MSSETSEFTTYDLNLIETELTLGLPGESRGRKLAKKRRLIESLDDIRSDATKCPLDEKQAIGWPPVTLHRKNSNFKFVKVAVDGAPYMRKVDLELYGDYQQLQCALVEIFSYFTLENALSENNLLDVVNGRMYVSMYEDKFGDWMLVGDVPWKMFVETCKRIRLMRRSEAINAAPRTSSRGSNLSVF
ncbi:putative transcription factor interactor and regulator AUX-IAA family [Helianthus annuus]|nr:putative transcription factor interactor and regulator AUX-IAA family [Helianthus annuus]